MVQDAVFQRPPESYRVQLPSLNLHCLDWPDSDTPVLLLHPNRIDARVWDFVVEYSCLPNRFNAARWGSWPRAFSLSRT